MCRFLTSKFLSPLVFISLVGCSSVPSQQKERVLGDDIAQTELSGDLLYSLLAGEFAGVRGQMDESIGYYMHAAEISNDPKVITRAAYIALYGGNSEQAVRITDRWTSLNLPKSDGITRMRAMAFVRLGQLTPAVESIEQLLFDQGQLNERAVVSLTHILGKETTPLFSLEVAQQLNQRHPEQAFIMLLLAKFEANLGKYDDALVHVDQLIELDDSLVDAYLVKAQILSGLKNQPAAMQAILSAVEKRPADTRLRMQYARMLVQMKAFDQALEHFLELKKLMPDNENVLLSLGLLSIELNKHDQAKEYLQELLNKGYHNQQAHYYLGRIQQNQGEDMAAIANYDRVYNGEYWLDAKIRSAGLISDSGQVDDALSRLEALNHGNQDENNQIKVYLAQGEVLRSVSRHQEAYFLYNTALVISPENTDLLYARALTAEKLNMLDVTESDLKMVLMHEPKNASALNALGYTLADRTERLAEAREYILKAAELLPDDPAVLDSLGWVYFRLGEYQAAIKWLNKAFDILQDAEIAAHLGEALWVNGQAEKAKSIWQKGEQLDGNQSVLRDTIHRFKE
jgi:tetratricopeptide (TPR) repeat protein